MILLHRPTPAREPIRVNPDRIARLEPVGTETRVVFVDGDVIVVAESDEEVFNRIVEVRAVTQAVALRLDRDPDFDHRRFLDGTGVPTHYHDGEVG